MYIGDCLLVMMDFVEWLSSKSGRKFFFKFFSCIHLVLVVGISIEYAFVCPLLGDPFVCPLLSVVI